MPSSTVASGPTLSSNETTNSVQTHARQLRSLLESLDDLHRQRAQVVNRARARAEAEDITPRILKAAAGFERWVEVQPSMFDDILDEEIAKFEKFKDDLEEIEHEQEVLLESIKVRLNLVALMCASSDDHFQERSLMFLESRKEDTSVKEREHALQSLDLAYHKYKEITRNLDEGLKVGYTYHAASADMSMNMIFSFTTISGLF